LGDQFRSERRGRIVLVVSVLLVLVSVDDEVNAVLLVVADPWSVPEAVLGVVELAGVEVVVDSVVLDGEVLTVVLVVSVALMLAEVELLDGLV
jgi:hypothetical protein